MKKVTYLSQALAVLFITSILIISGCKDKSSTPSEGGSSTTPANSAARKSPIEKMFKLPDGNDTAVTVNGVAIKEKAVQEIIKPEIDNIKDALLNSTQPLPEESRVSQFMKEIWQNALTQLIKEELLKEDVKDVNIVISDEEADDFFKKRLKQASVDFENFNKVLEEKGISYQEILEDAKKELTYIKHIESQMDESEKVTEEDAKAFYDDNIEKFTIPEQVKASHILIMSSKSDSNDVRLKAKEKIEDLLKQIKEGADFAELAKENSDDTQSAIDGGNLNYFPKDRMVPEFAEVAFALEPNQVSDIVETDYGYHIIKVTDHKAKEIVSFDEIKEDLTESLNNEKIDDFISNYIEKLLKNADIKSPEGKEIDFKFSE